MGIFNKYVFVNDNQAVKDAAHIVAKASRDHDETIKGISEAEIKSKDRVDISLKEYELLKKENQALQERCMHYEAVFRHIHINPKVLEKIVPESVHKWEMDNIRDFTKRIRIEFDIDAFGLRNV